MGAERQAAWNSSVSLSVCVRELEGVGDLCMAVCCAPGLGREGRGEQVCGELPEEPRGAAGVERAQPESMLGAGD